MNENTERSFVVLTNAIMTATTEKKRSAACKLVIYALEDRDREINKAWDKYEKLRLKYNSLISEFENIKLRSKIES